MELREYTPTRVELSPDELSHLLPLVRGHSDDEGEAALLQALQPTAIPNVFELRSGHYVGRLGLPSGRWIDFTSRFALGDVIELIRLSGRRPLRIDSLVADAGSARFLVDGIAVSFCREVERLVGRGLAKGYRDRLRRSPPFGGRIDITSHLAVFAARADRLRTIERLLTVDIPINQALARAHEILAHAPLSAAVRKRVDQLGPAFGPIARTVTTSHHVRGLRTDRLTAHYQPALDLAAVILEGQATAPRGTGLAGGSMLFSMAKVWESFVASWIRATTLGIVRSPYSFVLTSEGDLAEADVVVFDEARLVALYDAKYKWPDKAPVRSDLYQMIVYCDRLGIDEATLIYPVAGVNKTVTVGTKRVHVLGLSPSSAMGAIRSNEEAA